MVENSVNYTKYFNVDPSITNSMTKYSYTFTPAVSDSSVQLVFGLGNVNGTVASHDVYIDNVVFEEVGTIPTPTVTPTATPTITPTATPTVQPVSNNIINNGDFSGGSTSWGFWAGSGATASNTVANGENKTSISNVGTDYWTIQVFQKTFAITGGKTYTLSFSARSSVARDIRALVENSVNYTKYLNVSPSVTGTMTTFSYTFTPTASDSSVQLVFGLGNVSGTVANHDVYIDNVIVEEVAE